MQQKFNYRVYKRPPLTPVFRQPNSAYTLLPRLPTMNWWIRRGEHKSFTETISRYQKCQQHKVVFPE